MKPELLPKGVSPGKKTVESFMKVIKVTCTEVLNSVTTEYVNSLEQSVEKCLATYLESPKCRSLIEANAQKIKDHLNNIQSCITQVTDELKSHSRSCNKPETYSTVDSVASSSSAITDKSSFCNYLQLKPSSHSSLESTEKSCIVPQSIEEASSSHHQSPSNHNEGVTCNEDVDEEEERADRELQKKIRGYEKLLKKLNDKIKTYRESEIMDDDDEDSAYIRQDRLERKALQISKILWKLNNASFNTGRPVQKKIQYEGTRYPDVNKAIQNLINKKKIFPDFTDVLEVIDVTNKEYELCIPDIFILAKTVFQDVFHEIKDRRIQDHEMHFSDLLGDEYQEDPAENNVEWQQQLEENNIQGQQRIQEIIDHYATIPEKQKSENPNNENPKEEEENSEEDDDEDDKSDNEEEKSDNEEEKLDAENGDIFIENECLSSSESDHDGRL